MSKIKQIFQGLKSFMEQSHRWWHIACGFLVGLFFGADAAACVGIAFECKDVQHDPRNAKRTFRDWTWKAWDWVDFACTVAGGVVGMLGRIGLIGLIGGVEIEDWIDVLLLI